MNNDKLDKDCTDEVSYISNTNKSSITKLNNKNVIQIEEDNDIESNKNRTISTATILNKEPNTNKCLNTNIICLPCKNGDFPSGIYRCVFCNKSVHLFGCSVDHICHISTNLKKITLKNNGKEKEKYPTHPTDVPQTHILYLSQPGFDHFNLNEKGSITFLKKWEYISK